MDGRDRLLTPTTAMPTKRTKAPRPTKGPKPTKAPKPTKGPKPTKAPKPTKGPKPTRAPKPPKTPKPTKGPKPTRAPKPAKTPKPTKDEKGDKSQTPRPTGYEQERIAAVDVNGYTVTSTGYSMQTEIIGAVSAAAVLAVFAYSACKGRKEVDDYAVLEDETI